MLGSPSPFNWFDAALTGPGAGWLALGLLACVGLVMGLAILVRLDRWRGGGAIRRLRGAVLSGESGVATIEFVLVSPVVLFFALVLLQTTLAMVGNAYVHYAAFAATRAAIVQVPADHGDPAEPRNTIVVSRGYEKFDRIHAAAVFAVMPVAGRLDDSDYPGDLVRDGIDALFVAQGRTSPAWVDNFVAQRIHYAAENTEVSLYEAGTFDHEVVFAEVFGSHDFGPRDAVRVRVDHKLNLAVPYVRPIFSDGEHDTAEGPGAYAEVSATSTLTNEGLNPDLPPLPELPRTP